MSHGDWVLVLFVLGAVLTCAGALLTTWWLLGPGMVVLLGSFVLTAWEREAHDKGWRWPR